MPCGMINHGDGGARYAQAKALLFHHSLDVPPEYAYGKDGQLLYGILSAPNGKLYSKYGIGTSLVWMIPTAFAFLLSRVTHANLDTLAGFCISFVNPIIVVALAISMNWILRQFNLAARTRQITLLLYLFGASTLPYANTAFSEPLLALLLLWAIVLPVLRPGPKSAIFSGALLTFCTLTKPEFAPLPACLLPLFATKQNRRSLIAFCAAAAAGGLFLALDNLVSRGSITHFSYGSESSQFQAPWNALRHYFGGINRNLLLFNPALPLALIGGIVLWKQLPWRPILLTTLLIWAVYLPFYASWWEWGGGMAFGPRFFQSFIPVTFLPAGAGLLWLFEKGRHQTKWATAAAAAICGAIVLTLPLQISGFSVRDEQAVLVSRAAGRSEPFTHLKLLQLKLTRGIRHPELYLKSDFTQLHPGEPDTVLDFRSKPTYQYLSYWWAIYFANKIRHTNSTLHL